MKNTKLMGLTIQIYKQRSKGKAKCLTVHGLTQEQIYNHIKFYFTLLNQQGNKTIKIMEEE